MKRREFIKNIVKTGIVGATLPASSIVYAAPEDYTGRLFLTVQAEGAWDVTSFCDPKMNVPGEAQINHWAITNQTQQAGNINYAPFGNNSAFFDRFKNDMLVINGIDSQTNSHTTGVVHNWSGRVSEGYPSLSGLFASINAPNLPLAYINNGGYGATSKLIRYSRMNDTDALINILNPNTPTWDSQQRWHSQSQLDILNAHREQRLQRLLNEGQISPRQAYNRQSFQSASAQSTAFSSFSSVIPAQEDLQQPVNVGGYEQAFLRQLQLSLISFQFGMCCSADVVLGGFDTHNEHDRDHEPLLAHLADGLTYLWDYAEQLGIADRLTVLVTSDFGRTPYYNVTNGKDHWPINSALIMEKNPTWGNRVVGSTDEGHNAHRINPVTLQRDETENGTIIYPKHIHKAMREYLSLNNHSNSLLFPFDNVEDFDFFNPNLQTAGVVSDPRNTVRNV